MNYMQRTDDLVGYMYAADVWCATDLIDRLIKEGRVHSKSTYATVENVETMLDALANVENVDRYDESTYDSDDFPKVLFRGDMRGVESIDPDSEESPDQCCDCGCELVEEDAIRWMDKDGNWH